MIDMTDFETRRIGRTGVTVTAMGFGGVGLGQRVGRIDETQADATVQAAYGEGIRYYDTSPWYGHGLSEHRTGHVLRTLPRDDFVLSTKVGRIFHRPANPSTFDTGAWQGGLPFDYRRDYTAAGVQRSYEDSLLRLGMNRVDMLFVHDIDPRHMSPENDYGRVGGIEGAFRQLESGKGWQALSNMRASSEIGAIGFGVNYASMIPRFLERFDPDVFLVAMPYTLLDQDALDEAFPLCAERGIGIVIGSVFSSGILATGIRDDAVYGYNAPPPAVVEKVRAMETICARHGSTIQAAALQFPLLHPIVAAIIPGAMASAQVAENVALFGDPVPQDCWNELKSEGLLHKDAPTGHGSSN
jgi:D-threo-aldose 1-dehydrogenase